MYRLSIKKEIGYFTNLKDLQNWLKKPTGSWGKVQEESSLNMIIGDGFEPVIDEVKMEEGNCSSCGKPFTSCTCYEDQGQAS